MLRIRTAQFGISDPLKERQMEDSMGSMDPANAEAKPMSMDRIMPQQGRDNMDANHRMSVINEAIQGLNRLGDPALQDIIQQLTDLSQVPQVPQAVASSRQSILRSGSYYDKQLMESRLHPSASQKIRTGQHQ